MDLKEMLDSLRSYWVVEINGDQHGWVVTLGTKFSNETYQYHDADLRRAVADAHAGVRPTPRPVFVAMDSE